MPKIQNREALTVPRRREQAASSLSMQRPLQLFPNFRWAENAEALPPLDQALEPADGRIVIVRCKKTRDPLLEQRVDRLVGSKKMY